MDNILTLINPRESEQVEFKQLFDKETIETVVALANTKRGRIFIGIKNNGSLCYQSRIRNKLIAEAFYIEKYGRGYIRIRKAIQAYETMEFDYEESGDGYLMTLSYSEQKTTRELILSLLEENPYLTRVELAEKIRVSPDGIKQHIFKLKSEDLLERMGGRKEGCWRGLV